MNNKSLPVGRQGFTLIELLMYVALSALLILSTGKLLKSFLDYQEFIEEGVVSYSETSLRILNNIGHETQLSSGFNITESGARVEIFREGGNIFFFVDSGRLKKQYQDQEAFYVTPTNIVVDSITFSKIGAILRVKVSINGGAYATQGDFLPRNEVYQ